MLNMYEVESLCNYKYRGGKAYLYRETVLVEAPSEEAAIIRAKAFYDNVNRGMMEAYEVYEYRYQDTFRCYPVNIAEDAERLVLTIDENGEMF